MTQQSDSTRQKISAILNQIGMTDEELYQLLYGKKQQVEIEIALPQLMDEEIWLQTEHTEEELAHMSQQISVLEQLVNTPPEGAALAALENLLEGQMIPDEARGFLLKKYFKNWRKGMAQFLAFLAFSKLQQLAFSLANLTAPNLLSQFEKTKNRPSDRELLANFILAQMEKPLPPVIGMVADAGAILGATGGLEFHQPLTAALLQQSPDKIAQLLNILQTEPEVPLAETATESPSDLSKIQSTKQKNQAIAQLSKLVLLDRVETMVANQQALQEQTQQQTSEQQQQQTTRTRRTRVNRRQMREAAEREAQEKAVTQQSQPFEAEPQQTRPTFTQRVTNARPQLQPPVVVRKPTPPPPPKKPAPAAAAPDNNLKGLFADIPLAGLQGVTVSAVDPEQLGKTKSSLPKDHSIKPITPIER